MNYDETNQKMANYLQMGTLRQGIPCQAIPSPDIGNLQPRAIEQPPLPIVLLLEATQLSMGKVLEAIQALEDRLSPICSAPNPKNETKSIGGVGQSRLSEAIAQHNYKLAMAYERICDLVSRLEM